MVMLFWVCVMTQAMFPGAERAMNLRMTAVGAQMRAYIETQEDERESRAISARRSVANLERYRTVAAVR